MLGFCEGQIFSLERQIEEYPGAGEISIRKNNRDTEAGYDLNITVVNGKTKSRVYRCLVCLGNASIIPDIGQEIRNIFGKQIHLPYRIPDHREPKVFILKILFISQYRCTGYRRGIAVGLGDVGISKIVVGDEFVRNPFGNCQTKLSPQAT